MAGGSDVWEIMQTDILVVGGGFGGLWAALMRKESRESIFYREDYPEPDNENWLKWIIAEKGKDGEIRFTTEPVPFEKYKFKP